VLTFAAHLNFVPPTSAAAQSIDLRGLLLSLHAFFEALGVEEIRRRSHADDKPLRMVKTILHELCKLKGTEIYK
jgi:cytoskeleton-associated protein 5